MKQVSISSHGEKHSISNSVKSFDRSFFTRTQDSGEVIASYTEYSDLQRQETSKPLPISPFPLRKFRIAHDASFYENVVPPELIISFFPFSDDTKVKIFVCINK